MTAPRQQERYANAAQALDALKQLAVKRNPWTRGAIALSLSGIVAVASGIALHEVIFRRMIFGEPSPSSSIEQLFSTQSCVGCDLSGAYLKGADLRGVDLTGANLRGADLRKADLRGAYLAKTNLTSAQIEGAILASTDLRGATMPDGSIHP